MQTRKLSILLSEYGSSHQNPTNKAIHWIMVPLIYLAITALLWEVKLTGDLNAALVISIPVILYYLSLSAKLGIGMVLFNGICLAICYVAEQGIAIPLWQLAIALFVPAWVFQFIGHHIEGKRPSFLKDLQFLLIGPAWLMADLYRKLSIRLT